MKYKYLKCSRCGMIMRLDNNEEDSCIFCEAEMDEREEVTEREWRKYWIGIKGQPYQYNDLKKTKQEELKGGDIYAK